MEQWERDLNPSAVPSTRRRLCLNVLLSRIFIALICSVFNGGTGEARTLDLRNAIAALIPTELQSQIERLATLGKQRVLTAAEYPTVHMAQG